MDSPTSTGAGDSNWISVRSSMIESFKGCGLSGLRIDKEELRKKLLVPQYLRFAMRDSIRLKDAHARESCLPGVGHASVIENEEPPESPLIVFINPHSSGRRGPMLKERLQLLISKEQVNEIDEIL